MFGLIDENSAVVYARQIGFSFTTGKTILLLSRNIVLVPKIFVNYTFNQDEARDNHFEVISHIDESMCTTQSFSLKKVLVDLNHT